MSVVARPAGPADAAPTDLWYFVRVLRGALPEPVGRGIVEVFGDSPRLRPSLLNHEEYRPGARRSAQLSIVREARRLGAPRARGLARKLSNCVFGWMDAYTTSLDSHLRLGRFTDPTLLRYEPGDFFHRHCDGLPLAGRVVSAVALLPSAFDGGELRMLDDRHVDLEPGDVCVFPSNFLYPHEVTEVTDGVRLSIITRMQ